MPGLRQSGVTLLELLVAVAVFAVVAAIAFSGLDSVLQGRARTDEAAARLQALQTALLWLERDVAQAVDRPVRDRFGNGQPPLRGGTLTLVSLELTRAGHANPLQQPRGNLLRVAYRVEDGRLLRMTWPALDRAPYAEPAERTLLDGVQSLEVRFRDQAGRWHGSWPPPAAESGQAPPLPRAVELELALDELGAIRRLIPIAGPGP